MSTIGELIAECFTLDKDIYLTNKNSNYVLSQLNNISDLIIDEFLYDSEVTEIFQAVLDTDEDYINADNTIFEKLFMNNIIEEKLYKILHLSIDLEEYEVSTNFRNFIKKYKELY